MDTNKNELDIQDMQRAAKGDIEAFGGIVARNQNFLMNYFRRLGVSKDKAEDLTQETFLKVFQWRDRYKPTGKFSTFLFTLARHARVDYLRKLGRTIKTSHDELINETSGETNIQYKAELKLDIQTALGQLSEKLRMTVVLNVYQGLNYREIGEVLEIPEGTVKSRMAKAFVILREFLEK